MRLLLYAFVAYAWLTLIGNPHWFWHHILTFVTILFLLGYAAFKRSRRPE